MNLNEQDLLICVIFNVCRKAVISCLPNKSNLDRWKITEDKQCFICHHMQAQLHVLPNWEKYLNRHTWIHDSVLNSLLQQFSKILKTSSKIYCDSNKLQYNTTLQLFTTQRPDITILDGDEMTLIELTICFETNTLKSREYKIKRYKGLKSQLLQPVSKFKVLFLEITSFGFISKQS